MKLDPHELQALHQHPGEPLLTQDDGSNEIFVVINHQRYDELVSAPADEEKLRQAIRNRRDESRRLNQEWAEADQAVWNQQDDR